jgi:hypothetical protein
MTHKGREVANSRVKCNHCGKDTTKGNIKKHESSCYLNPLVIQYCKNCDKPIKNYKFSKGTCSRACANTFFRSGEQNGNWGGERYQTLCFTKHERKCVVCDERKILAVHHYDEDHSNDKIENLVPLCPTHHQYVHSKYKDEVISIIDEYVEEFIRGLA